MAKGFTFEEATQPQGQDTLGFSWEEAIAPKKKKPEDEGFSFEEAMGAQETKPIPISRGPVKGQSTLTVPGRPAEAAAPVNKQTANPFDQFDKKPAPKPAAKPAEEPFALTPEDALLSSFATPFQQPKPEAQAPKPKEEPRAYKSRVEALDDAVNMLEEGFDQKQVVNAFNKLGVSWDEIIKHGKARQSEYFRAGTPLPVEQQRRGMEALLRKPTPPAELKAAPEPGLVQGTINALKRGKANVSDLATNMMYESRLLSPEEAGQIIARNAKQRSAAAPSYEAQKGMEAIGNAKTYGDAAKALYDNPLATFTMLTDSAIQTIPGLAALAVSAPLGGLARAATAFGTSGTMEYAGVITDVLQENGVDLMNAQDVAKALRNPKLVQEMNDKGLQRGLAVGVFDALTAGLAGRFMDPAQEMVAASKLAGKQAKKVTAAAWAKELSVQMAGGAAGEAVAQKLTGEERPADVILEALAEGVTAPVDVLSALSGRERAPSEVPPVGGAVPPEERVEPTFGAEPTITPERVEPTFGAEPTVEPAVQPAAPEEPAVPGMVTAEMLAPEEAAITEAQGAPTTLPDVVRNWDRANRSGRQTEWQVGAAESNPAFEEVGAAGYDTPAHGMAKAATLGEAYQNLVNMLSGGIDQTRTLFTAGLTAPTGTGAGSGTAGGYAYRDGPFIITFRQGLVGSPTSSDVTGVLVNPANSELVPLLQQQFPNLVVRTYNEAADVVAASRQSPEGRVAPDEPATPPAAKAAVTPVQEPSNETAAVGMAVQEVPLKDLTLSKDVPQFKMGADAKGVVEPLGGKFERTGVAPIQVWRRMDGSMEVISGRHRLDLARRSGEKTIPAQVHDESQGFTPTMAAILDAELNIRDGQGKVKDYVNYFKAAGISPEDAESRGLLARSTGKRAYTIATTGSDELVAAVRNDQVGDEAAYYIALNAPNDPRLQSVGMQAVMDGKSANLAVNTMNALKALGVEQDTTTDMFGFDDSAMKEAAAMAQVANRKQKEIQTRLAAITGAAKRPELAKAEGIDVRDPEAVNRRIGELRQMKNAWDNWATNPELIGEIRQERGAAAPSLTLRGETEEEIRAREEAAAAEEQRRRSEEEAARRAEQAEVERKRAEETTDLFQLGQTAEQQMSGMGDLFAAPAAPEVKPEAADTEQLSRLIGELQKARSEQEFTDAAVALGESVPKQPFLGVQLKEPSSGVRFNIARSSDGNRIVFDAGYDDPDGFEIARKPNQAWKLTKTPRFATQIIERNQAAEQPAEKPAFQVGERVVYNRPESTIFPDEFPAAQIGATVDFVYSNNRVAIVRDDNGQTEVVPANDLSKPAPKKPAAKKEAKANEYFVENLGETLPFPDIIEWYRRAYRNMEQARDAYRKGEINDEQFLDQKNEFDEIKAEVEKIEAKEYRKPAAKPAEVKEPPEIRQARREMAQGVKLTPAVLRRRNALAEWEKSQKPAPAIEPEVTAENVVNGKKPAANLPAENRLVFMPCSAKKGGKAGFAMDLYQGVFFQTFRSNVSSDAMPNVIILSAEHGFIGPETKIEPYDRLLDKARADEMLGDMSKVISQIKQVMASLPEVSPREGYRYDIQDVLLVGGKEYQAVMRAALAQMKEDGLIPEGASVNATSGGIGEQRQQLGQYLRALPSEAGPAAKPAEEKPPYTPEQREEAEIHAKEVGGDVAWQRGDYALIRGYSMLSGDPVYAPAMGSSRARVDIASFTGKQIPDDVKQEMLEAKERLEKEAAEAHASNPFIKFKDGVALSEDIPEDLAGVIRGWKNLLKLDVPIYVSTLEDAKRNRSKFTGPHRRIGSGTLDENERGSMRRMADDSYYILFERSTSPSLMLETIAHEMGHVHQRVVYEKASDADKQALQEAHKRWLESQKGKTAKELVEALRTRAAGRRVKGRPDMKAEDLTSYWKSFSEWYADQTARWAVSGAVPVSVVEKFFKRLGNQLRRFYQSLRGQKYLPDETFKEFIERAISPTYMGSTDQTLPASDKAEQQLRDVERESATWSPDRVDLLVREFQYTQTGRESDTKAYAAFIDPTEFVRATTGPGELRQELLRAEEGLDMKRLREERQTPFLTVEFVPGEKAMWRIEGHEGRHRMAALAASGVKRVPVLVRMAGEAKAWPPIKEQWLSGQKFGPTSREKGDAVQITDLTPISFARRDELQKKFAGEGVAAFNVEVMPDTIKVDGKDRPTRNSAGRLIHPTESGVRNFWRWFGDSKVVDENGEPLVVYHGSPSKFTEFKSKSDAHWFTDQRDAAATQGENIVAAYLSISNPYRWKVGDPEPDERAFREKLTQQGYDGVIAPSNIGNFDYVAFSPTQIKSATGNLGAFAPTEPSIIADIESTKPTKRMSDEDIRDEQIREYSALRQRLAAVPRRIAAGKSALPDGPAKGMTELERVYLKALVDRAQDLKAAIKISAPRLDSPEQFLARALKEYDAGNISKEVLDVIQAAYKQQPGLLNGLKLSIKQVPEGAGRVAGAFLNMSRIVRLYKGSSGVDDPKTIRHELTHSMEQMMTPEQRGVIIDKWQDDLAKAIRKNKDAAHQKYFEALLKFLDKPTMENYKAAIAAMPSYDMYQFINPSEYWAVNAENLMASQLGGHWQRFKAAMKRMFEALKDLFGFDNKYAVQRVFKDIMTGSKERVTTEMLADRAGIAVSPAQNIEEDKALIEKYKRPKTPMLDKKPLATFLLDQFKNGKDLFRDFVENPKEAAADAGNSLIDGALRARMATVWYGAGLESRDFAKYGGQLRTSEDLATASVALDNAIRSGNIGVEVIFRGGLEFDKDKLQLVAVETKKGMRGVYDAERRLKDKLGNQLGTDIIQGYLEAKRSISIMNEFYERQAAYEGAKDDLRLLREQGASEKKIDAAVAFMEDAERSLESVKKAVSSVTMTEEEMTEFAARDQAHPELREIMDNWTAVNKNMLRIWRDVGLLSQERYEALNAIEDYSPWYRIMQDEEDPHTPLMSTTRGLTNIGREKLFKRTKPTDVLDFKGKEGKKVLDESGNLIGMSFKVPPSTVLRVEVDGEKIKAKDLSVTADGRVMIKAPIDDASLVVFKVTRPIQNIVENMTQNVMRMTMNAIRQYAAGRIVSEYATRDPDGRIMTFPKEDLAKGRFSFVINGQRKVVEISDPLPLGAIYGMDSLNLKMFSLPAAFANFFRRTITLSGTFQLKQVFKDAPTAAAVTGVRNPVALILGTYKGLVTALLQPVGKKVGVDIEPVVDILKAAGIGGFQNPSRTPEAEVKRRLGIMNRNVFDFVIKSLDHIGDSADLAQRIAVYKRVMAETGNETQALYQAANVINFLHHGSSGAAQALVKTVPFAGAFANATDVLVNSLIGGGLKGMSRRKAVARLGVTTGMLIGITLLYAMLVSGDDKYKEQDDQTKLRNFFIPGTDIMLPINTSYAFFWKAMTEMLYNDAINKATPNEIDRTRLKKALSTAARDMLLGPEPVPQVVKGPIEIAIGYNFFTGRDIIPENLKNVEAFQQYTASTSELGKWLSSYTEIPGTDGKRILSPIEADHLIRSTFGTAGSVGQWVTNRIGVEAGTRPALTEKETPVTGAFLRPEVARGREDLFYDLRDRVNQKYKTLSELERDDEKKAEAYDEKHEDLLDLHKDVNKMAADLSDINAEIRELSTSQDIKMSPDARRAEIRALQKEKQEVLEDIYEMRRDAGL